MSKNTQTFSGAAQTPEGMLYNGAIFQPIIDKCEGCGRVRDFEGSQYCSSYPAPSAKWSMGICNFCTHQRANMSSATKVNPLKASKRAAKGRK